MTRRASPLPPQLAEWLPLAQDLSIIGCYAQARPPRARKAPRKATRSWPATEARGARGQTELGHGSNVRGIETTATFVRETDEFEINTPSLSAVPPPTASLPAPRCGLNNLCEGARPARGTPADAARVNI